MENSEQFVKFKKTAKITALHVWKSCNVKNYLFYSPEDFLQLAYFKLFKILDKIDTEKSIKQQKTFVAIAIRNHLFNIIRDARAKKRFGEKSFEDVNTLPENINNFDHDLSIKVKDIVSDLTEKEQHFCECLQHGMTKEKARKEVGWSSWTARMKIIKLKELFNEI